MLVVARFIFVVPFLLLVVLPMAGTLPHSSCHLQEAERSTIAGCTQQEAQG
jgi:hypothetical protein